MLALIKALFDYSLGSCVIKIVLYITLRYFVLLKVSCLFFFEHKNATPINKPQLPNRTPSQIGPHS